MKISKMVVQLLLILPYIKFTLSCCNNNLYYD